MTRHLITTIAWIAALLLFFLLTTTSVTLGNVFAAVLYGGIMYYVGVANEVAIRPLESPVVVESADSENRLQPEQNQSAIRAIDDTGGNK